MDMKVYLTFFFKRPKVHMKAELVILLSSSLHPFINAPVLGSRGQVSEMGLTGLKSRCWQSCVPSRGSRRESTSCLF